MRNAHRTRWSVLSAARVAQSARARRPSPPGYAGVRQEQERIRTPLVEQDAGNIEAHRPLSGNLPDVRTMRKIEECRAAVAQHTGESGIVLIALQSLVGRKGADERMCVLPVRLEPRSPRIGAGHQFSQVAQRLLLGSHREEQRPQRVGGWTVPSAERDLSTRMEQGAFGGGATLDSVCVEQTRGRPSLDASGELPREAGCVERACIHRNPARRKQVRRIAGEEDAVVAVRVRLFRGVAESRHSQRLAHR